MTKYKRWILLLTALTVFVVHVESLKATSLIHAGKFSKLLNTTTSTSSTTEEPQKDPLKDMVGEMPDEELFVEVNGTKIALTGIPQIDYVWDPNLPRELNGFNLSHYPFLDSMPADEDIGFDCEDKINGFYASIKFGCQLYHHCLYGVRSDFICANFTAFDQKTFICHFASEVDCKNSYKYWSRNDDLYKATTEKSTTLAAGLAPLFDRNLYKRPAPGSSPTNGATKVSQPSSQNKDTPLAPLPLGNLPTLKNTNNKSNNNNPPANNNNGNTGVAANDEFAAPVRPANRPLRRPYRRRRPQIDYYYYDDEYDEDEFYDDRGRRRQQRPRNRRPIYDDYDSRRPDRRPLDDDFEDYEYDRRPYRSRNRSESRRNGDDRRKNDDRRFDDRRRPYADDRKRPEDERRSYEERPVSEDRRPTGDRKRQDDDRNPPGDRKGNRRRNQDDVVEDKRRERLPERSEPTEKRHVSDDPFDDKVGKHGSSVFDRPRPSPKISRPVLLSEKNKYSLKAADRPTNVEDQKKKDDEYYEEYDDPVVPSSTTTTTSKPIPTTKGFSSRLRTSSNLQTTKKPTTTASTTTTTQEVEYYEDEDYENLTTPKPVEVVVSPKPLDRAALFNSRNRPTNEPNSLSSTYAPPAQASDNFRINRFKSPNEKLINETAIRDNAQKTSLPYFEETSPTSLPSTTSRKPLPSISFNKKFANKQTVFEPTTTETPKSGTQGETFDIDQRILLGQSNEQSEPDHLEEKDHKYVMRIFKRPFLPSRGGNPYKPRGLQPVGPAAAQQQPDQTFDLNNQQFTATGGELSPSTNFNTQPNNNDQRGEIHKTTLEDIYNEEYDVELNDALNPMLKPLTSSRGITGFSFSSLPNDDRDGYRSQSRQIIQRTEAPKPTSTTEQPQYEYEEVEYDYK